MLTVWILQIFKILILCHIFSFYISKMLESGGDHGQQRQQDNKKLGTNFLSGGDQIAKMVPIQRVKLMLQVGILEDFWANANIIFKFRLKSIL